MSSFDASAWRERAKKRFDKRGNNEQLAADMAAIAGLEKIVTWCAGRGIEVSFSSKDTDGVFDEKEKKLVLNSRLLPQRALHIGLHECGHIMIGSKKPDQRYGMGYSHATAEKSNPVANRIDILDEELGAWAKGKTLAKKLYIKVNNDAFLKDRNRYIMTYIKWVVRAHPYEHGACDD